MPVTDSTLIKISWGTRTETHTVAELRVKFEHHANNLFDDRVWTVDKLPSSYRGWDMSQCSTLDDVFAVIQPGEAWTCDNCTVSLAEVITHDEQEMSQGYHGPSFKPVAIPCRFCGAEDTSGECDECTEKLSDDFSESENVLADHDWDDFSLEEGEDMLDAIISMLDGFDADRMASYLMGVQDALNGVAAADALAAVKAFRHCGAGSRSHSEEYLAGHDRVTENSNVRGAK